jgi:outer membrane receptor protein involved in Fe transport
MPSAWLWSSVCLILVCGAHAEAADGRVVDRRTGLPVAGAEVAIIGAPGAARTDADGRFSWAPDPPLPATVVIMLPDGRVRRVIVPAGEDGSRWEIGIDAGVVEEVIVSGVAPSVEASPAAGRSLVSTGEIERRAPANLLQALENVPGVSGVGEGQAVVPAIRGLARGRSLVLVDGSRIFSERRAGASVTFLAPEAFDRVEVVRGPASVAYGSDAFGGVIAVRTRRAVAGAPFSPRLTTLVGDDRARRVTADVAGHLGRAVGVVVQGRYRTADDYTSPDGVVPNSAWEDAGGLARVDVNGGGRWTGSWQGDFVGDSGRPRSDSDVLRVSSPFERSRRATVGYDGTRVAGFDTLSVTSAGSWYEQRIEQDRLAVPGRPRRIDWADIEGTDVQVRAAGSRVFGDVRLLTGVDLQARPDMQARDIGIAHDASGAVTTVTETPTIAAASRTAAGVFVDVEAPLAARVTVSGGARVDAVRSRNEGGYFGDRAVSHTATSGMVALNVRPSDPLTLAVQVSRGFRDPMLSDRFYRGLVGRGFIIGNPDLAPETSLQFDGTARYTMLRITVGASLYHYQIADLIERYQSGTDTFLFRNRGEARVRGVELEVEGRLARGTSLNVVAQAAEGRVVEDAFWMDDIAPPSVMLQVRQAVGARATIFVRGAAFATDDRPGPTEVRAPGYVDVSAGLSWTLSRVATIRASATNLLDQRYYASQGPRWVLAPGATGAVVLVIGY